MTKDKQAIDQAFVGELKEIEIKLANCEPTDYEDVYDCLLAVIQEVRYRYEAANTRAAQDVEAVEVDELFSEICNLIDYGSQTPKPDIVDGAAIGINFALNHLASHNLIRTPREDVKKTDDGWPEYVMLGSRDEINDPNCFGQRKYVLAQKEVIK